MLLKRTAYSILGIISPRARFLLLLADYARLRLPCRQFQLQLASTNFKEHAAPPMRHMIRLLPFASMNAADDIFAGIMAYHAPPCRPASICLIWLSCCKIHFYFSRLHETSRAFHGHDLVLYRAMRTSRYDYASACCRYSRRFALC